MEKEILFENQTQGRCKIEKEGGYYRVSARCTYKDGIYRLYMTTPQQFTRLGVMIPESGELRLNRRISPHELGILPQDGEFVLMPGNKTPVLQKEMPAAIALPASGPVSEAPAGQTAAELYEASDGQQTGQTGEGPPGSETGETGKAQAENLSDSPSGLIDRWCACENASDFTGDAILKPLLSTLEGVLYRYRGGGVELAVPAQAAGAISAVLCLTRAEQIRDADYFVVSLDREGFPSPAIPSSKY